MLAIRLLTLVLVANGAPLLAKRLLGNRWAWPIDAGRRCADGRPLLGHSKTWRGAASSVLCCLAVAPILGFSWQLAAIVGACAMLGDSLSSFTKRRLSIPSGQMALGLDQVPEALLPLLACQALLGFDGWSVVWLTVIFSVGLLLLSRILFAVGLRDTPY